jgi:RimJ/RimL family protein N-acetyltransferase
VSFPTLETERLLLRPFRPDDFDAYAEMCSDPEVMRYLTGAPLSRPEAWRHMAFIVGHWHLLGYGMWAVEEKATGNFLGRIGFNNPEGWPAFELGWTLARRYWGRGYASEGARAALAHAFTAMGRDHVISLILPGNQSSIRVAERLGERLEGRAEVVGKECLVYGIGRAEWTG